MSKQLSIAKQISSLKRGQFFHVTGKSARQNVCRIAKALRDAGLTELQIVTRKDGSKFKVVAI